MIENIKTTHALVINTVIVAVGNRKDMFKKCEKLETEGRYSRVFLFSNGLIGNRLGY